MTECNKSVYLANKSIDMIDAVNKGYTDGYNKAIDDCKELTFREVVYCDSLNDRTEFRELAEQFLAIINSLVVSVCISFIDCIYHINTFVCQVY